MSFSFRISFTHRSCPPNPRPGDTKGVGISVYVGQHDDWLSFLPQMNFAPNYRCLTPHLQDRPAPVSVYFFFFDKSFRFQTAWVWFGTLKQPSHPAEVCADVGTSRCLLCCRGDLCPRKWTVSVEMSVSTRFTMKWSLRIPKLSQNHNFSVHVKLQFCIFSWEFL